MYRNSKRNIIYPLVLALGVAAGIFIGKAVSHKRMSTKALMSSASNRFSQNKLVYALSLIDTRYVDKVNMDSLIDAAIPKVLSELDPHSVYIPAQQFADVSDALEGEFEGIGVVFNMITDTVVVSNVIKGGPSDMAGVLNGDRIIKIDDRLVAGQKIPQDSIPRMLKGKGGTQVGLSIQRSGVDDLVQITVTRGKVVVKSVDAAFMIHPGVGFIKLATFSKNSAEEIRSALSELAKQGMEKLIFDLRSNSGGFLDQAIMIANDFLPKGSLIVYTEYRDKTRKEQFSDGNGHFPDLELAVLIDENSASSSEILAGALQDNDRGTVIGRRSFGKGLVQEQVPFNDGSALRLTVARYYTPTGRSIQKPYDKGEAAYQMELGGRYMHDEFFVADSTRFDDDQKFVTPGGKVVYGGGGIMPDIFVPLDTTMATRYFMDVAKRNILFRYTIDYTDRHRAELNAIKSVDDLNAFFDADKDLLDGLVKYASQQGVAANNKEIRTSWPLLLSRVRAYVGRNTPLQDVGFYSQEYVTDDEILKALEVLGQE